VLTDAALDEARAELEAAGLCARAFEVQLKGFAEPVRLFRIDTAQGVDV